MEKEIIINMLEKIDVPTLGNIKYYLKKNNIVEINDKVKKYLDIIEEYYYNNEHTFECMFGGCDDPYLPIINKNILNSFTLAQLINFIEMMTLVNRITNNKLYNNELSYAISLKDYITNFIKNELVPRLNLDMLGCKLYFYGFQAQDYFELAKDYDYQANIKIKRL